MELDILKILGELSSTIAVVLLFLWYLSKRDADVRSLTQSVVQTLQENSKALAHLDDSVNEIKEMFRDRRPE